LFLSGKVRDGPGSGRAWIASKDPLGLSQPKVMVPKDPVYSERQNTSQC